MKSQIEKENEIKYCFLKEKKTKTLIVKFFSHQIKDDCLISVFNQSAMEQ